MSKFYTDVSINRGRIVHTGYDNGKKFVTVESFMPTLAIECNEDTGFKTILGKNAKVIGLDSIADFNRFKKQYSDTLELHGNISPIYQYISEKYDKDIDFNASDIRVLLYDIETIDDTRTFKGFPKPIDAPVPVVSIAIKDRKSDVMWLLSLKDYDVEYKKHKINCKRVVHLKCNSERHLLKNFIGMFERLQPDILIGYNNKNFDDPYILNRISKILGEEELKRLSPVGDVKFEFRQNKYGDTECKYHIKGVQILDYLELYKKFIPGGRESYSLSFISQYELGDDKVDYSNHENIIAFYIDEEQEFLFYNIYDVELLDLLDKKLKLIDLVYVITYMSKVNFSDIMSPIRTWDSIFYRYLKEQNIVIPPDKYEQRQQYPGAYVHDPVPGLRDWVVSFDLNALYPHLMIQYNISPECLVTRSIIDEDIRKIDQEIENLKLLL